MCFHGQQEPNSLQHTHSLSFTHIHLLFWQIEFLWKQKKEHISYGCEMFLNYGSLCQISYYHRFRQRATIKHLAVLLENVALSWKLSGVNKPYKEITFFLAHHNPKRWIQYTDVTSESSLQGYLVCNALDQNTDKIHTLFCLTVTNLNVFYVNRPSQSST